ncbi:MULTISPECIES: hypothetical protein [unclassified Mesorhizobium]|jgi:hypothetical protein|uniref:hypothetical protein n=1 Tax=unclassified Mesorhizobium TaxID=325217 RepID=UPI0008E5325B|nr:MULTISPECIES: hypothetical protein [unclassified Mesorhizobium]RJG45102.1 hypothetical protein D3Y55_13070 [Mesorhizobium sp. DCY119]SFT89934.1 hypothetical protein SAMN05518861_10748 [Mesorhizobium sp. YR577]
MKKLVFAFAAVLLGSGAALADSAPPSVIVNPNHVVVDRNTVQQPTGYSVSQNTRDSDAAPNSAVVASGPIDRSSTAAIEAPEYGPHRNDRDGDAQPSMR